MNKQIIFTLRDLGVPANILGYEYLKSAISICMNDKNAINQVTKVLYPQIAKSFDATPSRVERAIRHAIEVTWFRADTENLSRYFGSSIGHTVKNPTNSEFIAALVEQLRMDAEEESA